MTAPDDLFADQGPEFAPVPDRLQVVAGKVIATMNKPSAAQKRFNTLMARIDAEQALAAKLRAAMDAHGPVHRQTVREIATQTQQMCKRMVLVLDERIQAPSKPLGLTANQKQQATHILLSLCKDLDTEKDAQLQAVWARYDPANEDDADESEQAKLEAQEMLESFLGEDFAQGREFDSPEEVLRAALEFEQKKLQAAEEKRAAKRAARQAKKGLTAREQAAAQKEQDAQSALRTVFRQLASALHPDREPDEAMRKRKTELMSEVNTAYERKDFSTLLRIQLQEAMVDASKVAALSDAKLKAMCEMLTEQVKALEEDNHHLRQGMEFEFGYPAYRQYSEPDFVKVLYAVREDLQGDVAHMGADLARLQDSKEFKTWLKEQVRANKAQARYDADFGMDLDSMLGAMMRGR